jgi:drug/metabolite transporter, DME family
VGGDRERAAGYLYVLAAAGLWALITPGTRYLLEIGVGPLEIATWRCLMAWALFGVHLAVARESLRIRVSDLPAIIGLGLIGVAGLYVTLPLAVAAGGAALASILLYTAPAWVALLSWPLLRERITGTQAVALALTLGGVAAFAAGRGGGIGGGAWAIAWGLTAGICYASLYLFGTVLFRRYTPSVVFFWALPVAAIVLLPGATFVEKDALAWIVLGTLGVLSTYGAYLVYGAGLKRLGATRASITATLEPVLAGLLAFLLWNERFAAVGYLGGAAIIGAVVLNALSGARSPAGRPATQVQESGPDTTG